MRHGIAGNKLGRNSSWRKATIRDIAKATIKQQRICTTKAKAKEARKLVDQLITLGKKGELAHKRRAFAILCDHKLVSTLFREVAVRFKERKGGYTRIIPLGHRRGDNAELVYLELTDKAERIVTKKRKAVAKTADVTAPAKIKPEGKTKPENRSDTKKSPAAPQVKEPDKKHKPGPEKSKSGKKIVGGIKKMFRRKTSE